MNGDAPLRELLDKVNNTFICLEEEWRYGGCQIFTVTADDFEWKKHGEKHRIFYEGKPLVEQSYQKRIEAMKKLDVLTAAVKEEADRITAELLALLPEEGNK